MNPVPTLKEEAQTGEPETHLELLQHKVEHGVRDAWLALSELIKIRARYPEAEQFFRQNEGDLWSIKCKIELLTSELQATAKKEAA